MKALLKKLFGKKKPYKPMTTIELDDFTISVWHNGQGIEITDKRLQKLNPREDAPYVAIGKQFCPPVSETDENVSSIVISTDGLDGYKPTFANLVNAINEMNKYVNLVQDEYRIKCPKCHGKMYGTDNAEGVNECIHCKFRKSVTSAFSQ